MVYLIILDYASSEVHIHHFEETENFEDVVMDLGYHLSSCHWMTVYDLKLTIH